jgi:mono/diheme cytochrome c family protein
MRMPLRIAISSGALVLLLAAGYGAYWNGRALDHRRWALETTEGDPRDAPRIAIANGCAGCHVIHGVPGAAGVVGPPLNGMAERVYIAGQLKNTPDNLIRWIRDSRRINPRTAMPSTHISEQEARDVAAYLYALP